MNLVDDYDWYHHDDRDHDPYSDPEAIDALLAKYNGAAVPTPTPNDQLQPDPDLDDILNQPEPAYDWVIPNVLERGDRVILTGAEGAGKSTLLRQIAVQSAAGIHPFTLENMDPLTVLYIDLENSRKQSKRNLRPLRLAAGNRYPAKLMYPVIWPQGIDLTNIFDQEWFHERIKADQPDLVIIGPIYKMVGGDPTEEEPARKVALLLDQLRTHHGFALLIEAHSPHAAAGGKRPERPYGASLWVRWPEFGLHITDKGMLNHWRGDRDERKWPAQLTRGGEWPWTPQLDKRAHTFARILEVMETEGRPMSYRELGDALDVSKSWVESAIKANTDNKRQFDELTERMK